MNNGHPPDAPGTVEDADLVAALPVAVIPEKSDEVTELLRELQFAIIKHPVAAQALFRALVREGRRYAATPEGRAWQTALVQSDLIERGRVVWEVMTLKTLEPDGSELLPSKLVDAFAKASSVPHLEKFLIGLFDFPGLHENTTPPDRRQ